MHRIVESVGLKEEIVAQEQYVLQISDGIDTQHTHSQSFRKTQHCRPIATTVLLANLQKELAGYWRQCDICQKSSTQSSKVSDLTFGPCAYIGNQL